MRVWLDAVPPWSNTDYARQTRRYKFYATDTGLMASLLQWDEENVCDDVDRIGKLIEIYVYNELAIQCDLVGCSISQYRDKEKHEVDMILSHSGKLYAIKVKASESVRIDDFKHIVWFRKKFCKDVESLGIVLYCGCDSLSFGDGLLALPISCLW